VESHLAAAGVRLSMSPLKVSRRGFLGAAAASLAIGPAWAAAELQVDVDSHLAPALADWAAALPGLCRGWWPKIVAALDGPDAEASGAVQIVLAHIQPDKVAAVTRGRTIFADIDHVRTNMDAGFIAHELVHVAQHYPHPTVWLAEGIADYLRYYVLLPKDPQRAFPAGLSYEVGYQPAAALLDFAVRRHGPGVLRQVNAALRAGRDGDAALTAATGQTPAALWAAYQASVGAKGARVGSLRARSSFG